MAHSALLNLGARRTLDGAQGGMPLHLPANHLVTRGVAVGMTGSGKTGLLTVLIEEALLQRIPTIVIDVKGDLPNLLLAFPSFDSEFLSPCVDTEGEQNDGESTPNAALSKHPDVRGISVGFLSKLPFTASSDFVDLAPNPSVSISNLEGKPSPPCAAAL